MYTGSQVFASFPTRTRAPAAPFTQHGWRWIVDPHREGRRYILHSDELLSAFLELEATLL
jgi:hypothetical protein